MSYRKKKRFPNGRADPQQTTLTGMNANLQSTEELLSTGELYSEIGRASCRERVSA